MQEDIVKLTSAVYKLLDVFPENEPLKAKIKEKALLVLERASVVLGNRGWISVKAYILPERQQAAALLQENIVSVIQYLRLAQQQGWISDMNALVVIKQYQQLQAALPSQEQKTNTLTVLQRQTIVSSSSVALPQEKEVIAPRKPATKKPVVKKVLPEKTYTDRQRKILNIIAKKGQVQVADLLKEIPNITKRTLRRDMDDLLKKESVVREGQFNQVVYRAVG